MEILILILAYILDCLLADPRYLPHPIRLFGNCISFFEMKFNKGNFLFFKGLLLVLFLALITFLFFYTVNIFLEINIYLYVIWNIIFLFFALANKSLIDESKAVFTALEKGVEHGRKRLSWIVGRDTTNLSPEQITKAVFETMSENLSDGVIAPLFYFAILGVPGAMLYKMVNTLDSMIGYKNDRYMKFGKFAAKTDDVLNYIPSRITAFLMLLITNKLSLFFKVFKQAKNHLSPNAGYPEAALALILDCQFGGPNFYHGKIIEKPYIGFNNRIVFPSEFKKVVRINHRTTFIFVILICLVFFVLRYLF